MEVILLERVAKLGQMGEVVRVKDGFARNFLLPQGKALRATKDNRASSRGMKVELEARNLELKGEAEKVAEQAQRPELRRCCARRPKPASSTARCRRATSPRSSTDGASRVEPQPDRAQRADQDDRPAQGAGRAASGSRGRRSPSTSRAAPTRPSASPAARTSRSRATRRPKRPPSSRPRRKRSSSRKPPKRCRCATRAEKPTKAETEPKRRRTADDGAPAAAVLVSTAPSGFGTAAALPARPARCGGGASPAGLRLGRGVVGRSAAAARRAGAPAASAAPAAALGLASAAAAAARSGCVPAAWAARRAASAAGSVPWPPAAVLRLRLRGLLGRGSRLRRRRQIAGHRAAPLGPVV